MWTKLRLFLLIIAFLSLIIPAAISAPSPDLANNDATASNGQAAGNDLNTFDANDFNKAIAAGKQALYNGPDVEISLQGHTADVSGRVETNNGLITSAENLEYQGADLKDVKYFVPTNDGYTASSANRIEQDNVLINNGEGITFSDGILSAEKADSIIKDKSVTTNAKKAKIKTKTKIFSVKKADSMVSGGINVKNIDNTEFSVNDGEISMNTEENTNLHITGKDFLETQFKSNPNGKIIISKKENQYNISNGTLNMQNDNYNESFESNNSAQIEMDKTFGFKCITISPPGSYFYNDDDLRKDFVINVPRESTVYRLCLRKNIAQQFNNYDGLVDFANKKIELNKIVSYLRYPIKNNQISGLLSSFVYKGLKDLNAVFSYDNDLIFLKEISISNKSAVENGILSATYPSNYYTIKEIKINNEIRSIIELDLKTKKEDLNQNINYEYKTEYFRPKISITGNVLKQENGKNRLLILPPGHEKINDFLT